MSISRSRRASALLILGGLIQAASVSGCSGSNPNEKEFLNAAPPGEQTGDPNESYSQRRERTKNSSKKSDSANPAASKKAAGENPPR